jgi:hypothetical protein
MSFKKNDTILLRFIFLESQNMSKTYFQIVFLVSKLLLRNGYKSLKV